MSRGAGVHHEKALDLTGFVGFGAIGQSDLPTNTRIYAFNSHVSKGRKPNVACLRLHTLVTFLNLLLFILIEDPEGNMVRSVDLYSFYIAQASTLDLSGGLLVSRDPADARDVPAGPLVAPPRL